MSAGRTSWQRCRAALHTSRDIGQADTFATLRRPRNRDHGPHRGHAVVDSCALLWRTVQDRVRESLDLKFVTIRVLAERSTKLAVLRRETLHVTRFMVPRQVHETFDAAVLAVDLEALFKINAHRNGQIEMAQAAVRKIDADKPAIGAESCQQSGADHSDLAAQEPGRINEVTSVRQHEIPPLVRFRVAGRLAGLLTDHGN